MATSPLPIIQISLAPREEPQPEPYSPFSLKIAAYVTRDDDMYRPALLSPPVHSWAQGPRRIMPTQPRGRGLRDEDFQSLLRASRERSVAAVSHKQDLRKEVTLKAHKTKQLERRALFLSKIGAPPSPSATGTPKTPPDSPVLLHYSLPSPGLDSPLALYERLGLGDADSDDVHGSRQIRVEQVDFRLLRGLEPKSHLSPAIIESPDSPKCSSNVYAMHSVMPSLEQITARYTPQGNSGITSKPASARAPLPAFLNSKRQGSPPADASTLPIDGACRPRLINTGRIQVASRAASDLAKIPAAASTNVGSAIMSPVPRQASCVSCLQPDSPTYSSSPSPPIDPVAASPMLQITTTHVPLAPISRSPSRGLPLTEANLNALNSRARTAQDMLSAIRRRTATCSTDTLAGIWSRRMNSVTIPAFYCAGAAADENEKQRRRISAPAELVQRERSGFSYPVLALPGGF